MCIRDSILVTALLGIWACLSIGFFVWLVQGISNDHKREKEKAAPWSNAGIKGCRRFIERYWNLQSILVDGEEMCIRDRLCTALH